MKIKVVIFDLDGTLVDTISGLTEAINLVLSKRGYPIHDDAAVMSFVGNGISKFVERALPEDADQSAVHEDCYAQMMATYAVTYDHDLRLYEGVAALLDELVAKDVLMAIYTNKNYRMAQGIGEGFLGRWQFVQIIGESEDRPKKPDPSGIFEIMAQCGLEKDEVLYVGDSEVDIETARLASVKCLSALWGFRTEAYLDEFKPVHKIQHPLEVLEYLV